MVFSTDHLFDEYTKLRLNGMDKAEAAQALHTYLQESSGEQRKELAQLMRAWENSRTLESVSDTDRQRLKAAKQALDNKDTLICSNCGEKHPPKVTHCRVCNYPLVANRVQTDLLTAKTDELRSDILFNEEDSLLLIPKASGEIVRIKPQRFNRALTIGRLSELPEEQADVVLIKSDARKFGVSRLHAAIQYDSSEKMIQIKDLGSTNGTFINGRVLVPNENNYLHDGDILKLGGLSLSVTFTSILPN